VRVRLDFIGCRLNISEIESLSRQFKIAGHRVVGHGEAADLCVFNTCTVTHIASRTSRQKIRRLKRDNPDAAMVVTGCYAELEPDAIAALDVDLIVGNTEKDNLLQKIVAAGLIPPVGDIPAPDAAFPLPVPGEHTRACVKVQDGCDNRCTFCSVTLARGAGRSRTLAEVVDEIHRLEAAGYREAVLTGVHLGSFGHDRGNPHELSALVRAILAETDIPRLRLSSLEPWDLDAEFFSLWENPRLCRHLHLPLQSGSDSVLRRMARRTNQTQYAALIESARAAVPGISITTDIIVGFPGETDAEFADSLAFVDQMAFNDTHIFRYSPRTGTAAASMPAQVDPRVAHERSQQLHDLSARHARAFRQSLIGQTLPVLWETAEETVGGHLWSGLTDNYVRVSAFAAGNRHNQITLATLTHLLPDALAGDMAGETIPLQLAVG